MVTKATVILQNLPLPTTLRVVPLLLLLLVALLIVGITGILATHPLGTASTVHFAKLSVPFFNRRPWSHVECVYGTCLESADRSRPRLEKRG